MFNGIIKNIRFVKRILLKKNNCDIEIVTKMKFAKKEIGSSISCSGTCLTLESFRKDTIKFYISKETINKTNFKYLKNNKACLQDCCQTQQTCHYMGKYSERATKCRHDAY